MVKKKFDVSLDVKTSSSNRPIEVVEGDNGNEIRVLLTDDGEPVDLTDCRVLAIFSKSDGRTAEQDNLGHGIRMEEETGSFVIELYTGSFSPGLVECEIQILSGEDLSVLITSAKFNFSCRRSIMNADTVKATDEYPILVDLIDRVSTAEEELSVMAEQESVRCLAEAERLSEEEKRRKLSAIWAEPKISTVTLPPENEAEVSVELLETGAAFTFGIPKGKAGDNSLPHAHQHALGEEDAILPESIGAAAAAHTHPKEDIAGLAGFLRRTMEVEAVLSASAWEGNVQQLTLAGAGAQDEIEIGLAGSIDEETMLAAASAMLHATAQWEGGITVTAFGTVPDRDIPVLVRVGEVLV